MREEPANTEVLSVKEKKTLFIIALVLAILVALFIMITIYSTDVQYPQLLPT